MLAYALFYKNKENASQLSLKWKLTGKIDKSWKIYLVKWVWLNNSRISFFQSLRNWRYYFELSEIRLIRDVLKIDL